MFVYFLIGDRKEVDSDGRGGREELGGVEGGKKHNHDLLCKKISIFNKRKNNSQ